MATETVEMRMARLERGCERINERLGVIEHRLTGIDARLASSITSLGYEMLSALESLRAEVRAGDGTLKKEGGVHFYWVVTLVAGSMLVPLLLELAP